MRVAPSSWSDLYEHLGASNSSAERHPLAVAASVRTGVLVVGMSESTGFIAALGLVQTGSISRLGAGRLASSLVACPRAASDGSAADWVPARVSVGAAGAVGRFPLGIPYAGWSTIRVCTGLTAIERCAFPLVSSWSLVRSTV